MFSMPVSSNYLSSAVADVAGTDAGDPLTKSLQKNASGYLKNGGTMGGGGMDPAAYAQQLMHEQQTTQDQSAHLAGMQKKAVGATLGAAGAGAAKGASMGMTFGPWGALIGAGIGAIGGGLSKGIQNAKAAKEAAPAQQMNDAAQMSANAMRATG